MGSPPEVEVEEDPPGSGGRRGPTLEVVVGEDPPKSGCWRGPPRSGCRRGTPWKWTWKRTPQKWMQKRTPLEVDAEEDPPPPPRSGGGRGPAEKYCWASGWYALEKKASLFGEGFSLEQNNITFTIIRGKITYIINGIRHCKTQNVWFDC